MATLAGIPAAMAGVKTAAAQDVPARAETPASRGPAAEPPPPPISAEPVKVNEPAPAPAYGIEDGGLAQKLSAATASAAEDAKRLATELQGRRSHLDVLGSRRLAGQFSPRGTTPASFPTIRCDLLASEAASLVARCIGIRAQWDGVYEASYAFLTDIERFSVLDAIFRTQETNGYYDVDAALSSGDARGNAVLQSNMELALKTAMSLYERYRNSYDDMSEWQQLVGWLSHISAYGKTNFATATVTWKGMTKKVTDLSVEAANEISSNQLSTFMSQLGADLQTRNGQAEALQNRGPGLQAKAVWDEKNKAYRKAQVDAIRAIYKEKLRLANEPNGPLNYAGRLDVMQQTFTSTLSEALVRLPAVAEGLATVFGLQAPLPQSVLDAIASTAGAAPNAKVLDDTQTWLDQVASQLVLFLQTEQAYSVQVSLKQLVKAADWKRFQDHGALAFDLPPSQFADQFHVRLRALSVTTLGVRGGLGCVLTIPKSGIYLHKDGTTHRTTQDFIRPLRLARALPAEATAAPERFGLNMVYNASPIGSWQITTATQTNMAEPRRNVSDILFEMVVAGQ